MGVGGDTTHDKGITTSTTYSCSKLIHIRNMKNQCLYVSYFVYSTFKQLRLGASTASWSKLFHMQVSTHSKCVCTLYGIA